MLSCLNGIRRRWHNSHRPGVNTRHLSLELSKAICNQDLETIILLNQSSECPINGDRCEVVPPIIECVSSGVATGDEEDARRAEVLKILLLYGADVNVQSQMTLPPGKTAAICAAERGFLRCLKVLVESGAEVHILSPYGETAYTSAVMLGQVECVEYLTSHLSGSRLDQRNSDGRTALVLSASRLDLDKGAKTNHEKRNFRCLQNLIEAGADLNVEDKYGYTALMYALQHNNPKAITLLLEGGALVNSASHSGHTPISIAVAQFQYRLVPKLLKCGADPTLSRRQKVFFGDMVNDNHKVELRWLVMSGFPPLDAVITVRWFPEKRCFSRSPLTAAIFNRQPWIAKYLIANKFFTRYDIAELCWDKDTRESLRKARGQESTDCLKILDFLSKKPQSLQTLCLVAISEALSQDFVLEPSQRLSKYKWVCSPTYKERVDLLQIPPAMKRELLHQTDCARVSGESIKYILEEDELRLVTFPLSNTTLETRINKADIQAPFNSNIGTPQGDGLSPVLFTIYLKHALRKTQTVIDDPTTKLEELIPREIAYAEDVDFIGSQYIDIDAVENALKEFDLIVNVNKTELTSISKEETEWRKTKKVVSLMGDTKDVERRKQLSNVALYKLKNVWISKDKIKREIKIKLYKSLVKSILICNCGTWALTLTEANKLDTFHRKQLRNILDIHYPTLISNKSL
ncbi:ankyrin repeat protein [Elysia marginata]|uniref:Ankyrin repeat protein n=1 Tax=Elysia marginata TaxID=1093978 RepID=A0AAV4INE3_9GAST|nr:ankyrin repeat protein [Elysia marginata]